MPKSTEQKLLAKIELMQAQLQDLKRVVKREFSNKEWYSTAEAADKMEIKTKTAANYCGDGTFTHIRKKGGRWQIHKSELNGQ